MDEYQIKKVEPKFLDSVSCLFNNYVVDMTIVASKNGLNNFTNFNEVLKFANKNEELSLVDYYKNIMFFVKNNHFKNTLDDNNQEFLKLLNELNNCSKTNEDESKLTDYVEKLSTMFSCVCNEFDSRKQNLGYLSLSNFDKAEGVYGSDIWHNEKDAEEFENIKEEEIIFSHLGMIILTEGMQNYQNFVNENSDILTTNFKVLEDLNVESLE